MDFALKSTSELAARLAFFKTDREISPSDLEW
jgi:hypothetical protein